MTSPLSRHTPAWWLALLAAALLGGCAAARAADYQLGRGLRLPALDLTLAGYSSTRLQGLEGRPTAFDQRDTSLFVIWEPAPRWRAFGEFEVEHLFGVDDSGVHAHDTEFVVERLYVDFALTGRVELRAGRFLTPFGRWNLLHADPLVWTVTRPLVTSLAIPDHGTGVMVQGSVPVARNTLEYSVYLDDSAALDPVDEEASFEEFHIHTLSNNFDRAAGAQVRYHFLDERARIGLSYAAFDIDGTRGHQHAVGLDGLLRWHRWELSGEAAYRINTRHGTADDWGGFAQVVAPLVGALHAVGRFEFYSSGLLGEDAARVSAGLALRPHPALTLKLEYHDGNNRRLLPDGWEASCGILF